MPPQGENRITRHDRDAARLGGVAPARLGRAHHRVPHTRRLGEVDRRAPSFDTWLGRADRADCRGLRAKKAPTPGSSRARASASSAAWSTTRQTGRRSTTFSMSGSTPARPTPSCWRSAPTSLGRPRSISKARTSIAAGSNPRCLRLAARAAARLTTPCVTHGFVVDEDGRKMSKSLGNVVAPQDVIRQSGAEILRLWAMSSDYAEDLRIGPDIIKANVESYRKLRNTLRFLLGNLAHYRAKPCRRLRRDAGARALHALPPRRARSDRARRLPGLRLQARVPRAAQFLRQRSFGLLFRHPQGRALLRSL